MKIITLLNEKGGVGKSTMAALIASGLALLGHRVVIVDADAQGNVTSAFGLDKQPHFFMLCTLSPEELGKQRVTRLVPPEHYAPENSTSAGDLHCISSDTSTRKLAPLIANRQISKLILRERLSVMNGWADFVIIDTPPTPSDLHEAIAAATDYVIMPTQCEAFSGLEGLPDTIGHTANIAKLAAESGINVSQLVAIIPNMFEKKSTVHQEILPILQRNYGQLVWEEVPKTETIRQSHLRQRSLFALYPRVQVTKLMWTFVKRIEALA